MLIELDLAKNLAGRIIVVSLCAIAIIIEIVSYVLFLKKQRAELKELTERKWIPWRPGNEKEET